MIERIVEFIMSSSGIVLDIIFMSAVVLISQMPKKGKTRNAVNTNEKQYNIVEEIYFKKKKQYNRTLSIIYVSMLIYSNVNFLFNDDIKIEVLFFLGALFSLIIILKLLIEYRIKKEYYGTNYEESKEIIYHMIENKDKNDMNSGKKIFNDTYNKVSEQVPVLDGETQYQ